MKISKLSITDKKLHQYKKIVQTKLESTVSLKQDKFVKKDSVSGIEKIGFLVQEILNKSCCSKNEEEKLRKLVQSELQNIKSKERLLGTGFHESVYRLNDEFAVKFHPNEYPETIIGKEDSFNIFGNKFKELKVYHGEVIAQFGNFKILRNLGKHIPAGLPENLGGEKAIEYYRNQYLPTFSQVPQESYNALMQDCASLNKRYTDNIDFYCRIFDFINPNNIVLKNNKLFWVDQIRSDASEINSTIQVLNMMLNKYGIGGNNFVTEGFGNSVNYARTIFNKIILAGAEVNLPLRSSQEKFSNIIIANILSNLNIRKNPESFVNELENINKLSDKSQRVEKTKKYLENI